MKLQLLALCLLFVSAAYSVVTHDSIKRAIETHNPDALLQFNAGELGRLARQKNEYIRLAQEATQAAKSRLQRRFDWKDKMRLVAGLTMTGAGAYFLNSFKGFITGMNQHGFVDENGHHFYESAHPTALLNGAARGPLGALLVTQGLKHCYQGLTQHDRKQTVVKSMFVKNAIEEWGDALS